MPTIELLSQSTASSSMKLHHERAVRPGHRIWVLLLGTKWTSEEW
jgi:hypothetical protein